MSVESEIKTLLTAEATVTAITSRFYHVSPGDFLPTMPYVTYEAVLGGSVVYHALQGVITFYETIYRFHAFAKNTASSTGKDIVISLCNAVITALHAKSSTLIKGIFVDGAPVDAEVEDTENVAHRVVEFKIFHN